MATWARCKLGKAGVSNQTPRAGWAYSWSSSAQWQPSSVSCSFCCRADQRASAGSLMRRLVIRHSFRQADYSRYGLRSGSCCSLSDWYYSHSVPVGCSGNVRLDASDDCPIRAVPAPENLPHFAREPKLPHTPAALSRDVPTLLRSGNGRHDGGIVSSPEREPHTRRPRRLSENFHPGPFCESPRVLCTVVPLAGPLERHSRQWLRGNAAKASNHVDISFSVVVE